MKCLLLYIAFFEGRGGWLQARWENTWRDLHNQNFDYDNALWEVRKEMVAGDVQPEMQNYGGEGYRCMNFLNKWMDVVVGDTHGENILKIKWFETKKEWKRVMDKKK